MVGSSYFRPSSSSTPTGKSFISVLRRTCKIIDKIVMPHPVCVLIFYYKGLLHRRAPSHSSSRVPQLLSVPVRITRLHLQLHLIVTTIVPINPIRNPLQLSNTGRDASAVRYSPNDLTSVLSPVRACSIHISDASTDRPADGSATSIYLVVTAE